MQDFKVANNLNPIGPGGTGSPKADKAVGNGPSFGDALAENLKSKQGNVAQTDVAGAAGKLQFSNHAVDRMRFRGIRFSPAEMQKIEGAISKANAKGAKETLVLTDNAAMIVNVKSNKVVTVMDKANLKENVFTNIDSTVVI